MIREKPTEREWIDAVATLASFLVFAEESSSAPMFGACTALQALEACSALTRLPMDYLVEIAHAGDAP